MTGKQDITLAGSAGRSFDSWPVLGFVGGLDLSNVPYLTDLACVHCLGGNNGCTSDCSELSTGETSLCLDWINLGEKMMSHLSHSGRYLLLKACLETIGNLCHAENEPPL